MDKDPDEYGKEDGADEKKKNSTVNIKDDESEN